MNVIIDVEKNVKKVRDNKANGQGGEYGSSLERENFEIRSTAEIPIRLQFSFAKTQSLNMIYF